MSKVSFKISRDLKITKFVKKAISLFDCVLFFSLIGLPLYLYLAESFVSVKILVHSR